MNQFSVLEQFAITVIVCSSAWFMRLCFSICYKFYIRPVLSKFDFRSQGQWALITGCTDGIGKSYAEELAARGCDLIMISRSLEKLEEVAKQIENEYNVKTHTIQADFTKTDGLYERIEREIEGFEIGTLINNVGISYPYPEYFLEILSQSEVFDNLISANMVSVMRMCHVVVPQMIKRRRGVVINIGSGVAVNSAALIALYAASKRFVEKFTMELYQENKNSGVIFQCVIPAYVATKMTKMRRSTFWSPYAKDFVKSVIPFVGMARRTPGYMRHSFIGGFVDVLGFFSRNFVDNLLKKRMNEVRLRALARRKTN